MKGWIHQKDRSHLLCGQYALMSCRKCRAWSASASVLRQPSFSGSAVGGDGGIHRELLHHHHSERHHVQDHMGGAEGTAHYGNTEQHNFIPTGDGFRRGQALLWAGINVRRCKTHIQKAKKANTCRELQMEGLRCRALMEATTLNP